jgi:kynurenine formamidase
MSSLTKNKTQVTTSIILNEKNYQIELNKGKSIAIALDFVASNSLSADANNTKQPNHFDSSPATRCFMISGDFIGNTEQGGSCNVSELSLNPHCNGTHTETIAHICHFSEPMALKIAQINIPALMPCVLITIEPTTNTTDDYRPQLNKKDNVISRAQLESALKHFQDEQLQALAIRTIPNDQQKSLQTYSNDNQPAFFTIDAINYLNERGIEHLITDLPSIDRLHDDGLLTCHHIFWQVKEKSHQTNNNSLLTKTITEMAYISNDIVDGFYFVNLQTPAFLTDAAPSRPMMYKAKLL